MRRFGLVILTAGILSGCDVAEVNSGPFRGESAHSLRVDPLPVQQARAYPETVTGMFVSLADFEDTPGGPRGHRQIEHFTIDGPRQARSSRGGRHSAQKFVVNVTRTGAAAMEVVLAPKAELIFALPLIHDFTGYSLLSMAVHCETLRDDLQVTLTSRKGSWTSHRTLVRPGWNTVLIDIQRLTGADNFDVTSVRAVRIAFADAGGPVRFNLDDVMLIDNHRVVEPTPPGLVVRKAGLDYALQLPGRDEPLGITQSPDGLWRLGSYQALVQLTAGEATAPGAAARLRSPTSGERLKLMGRRKVGSVEVLESNAIRLRLANVWYFPTRAGEWASLAVRQVRWRYTFYADGRWITHLELNNAGGRPIGAVGILWPQPVAWAQGSLRRLLTIEKFAGPVARWNCLAAPPGLRAEVMRRNYIHPPKVTPVLAQAGFAPGDVDRDGFDESQGCYYLRARAGHCRFTVAATQVGLLNPIFRVAGNWKGPVQVNSEGMAIRDVVRLGDGAALFMLPGLLTRPTAVEVVGKVPALAE